MSKIRRIGYLVVVCVVAATGCSCSVQGFIRAQKTGNMILGQAPSRTTPWNQACGTEPLRSAGIAGFGRQPYVQSSTSTSIQILWTAAKVEDFRLRIYQPAQEKRDIVVAKTATKFGSEPQYVADIQGLSPGTTYCYEVLAGEVVWLGPTQVQSAPAKGQAGTVRIVAIGDLGYPSSDQRAVRGQWERMDHDLVLIAGDVAYNSGKLSEFNQNFFRPYQQILRHVPAFPALGNHDYRTASGGPFREVFALPENGGRLGRERWYSFDWGPIHVVILDTERLVAEQIDWLAADLGNTKQPWTFVVLHKPPFSSGHHGSSRAVRKAFVSLFERYRVQLVLAGHDHTYERIRPQSGVTYIVTGGGGRGTRSVGVSKLTAFTEQVAHFTYIVADEKTVRVYAIDATGQTFDTLRLVK